MTAREHSGPPTGMRSVLIIAGLMLGMSLAALESTVIGTAMPTIIGKLGGISLYSWVFSAYLLTSTTTVPIYGKLADLYGRKPIFLFGVALFLLGSALSGLSQTMMQLIIFRAIQGVGAGAVLPITMTIIGDLFSIEQRARLQGFFSGVWGVSSVVGPALGGLITDHVGWRWVFYLNVPFGLVSAVLIAVLLHERIEHRARQIDYLGSAALTAGVTALLWGLLQGGTAWDWSSVESLATFAASLLLLGLFVWNEGRAAEPVLPLSLFRNRIIAVASVGGLLAGAIQYGVTSYVPLWVQGVRDGTATDAGAVVAPMSFGWPVGSIIAGRMIVRFGYRLVTLAGGIFLLAGSLLLALLGRGTPRVELIGLLVLIGLGMGFLSTAFIIAIQNAVAWSQRGIATASNQFFRTIGGTIGVAAMGAVLAARWHGPAGADTSALLDPAQRGLLPSDILAALQDSLAGALHEIYLITGALAVLVFLTVIFFPRGRADELAVDAVPAELPTEGGEPVAAEAPDWAASSGL